MAKFKISEVVDPSAMMTMKLGASADVADRLNDNDIGKPVKLHATLFDTVILCADGDEMLGFLSSVQDATADGFAVGTIMVAKPGQLKRVELDGAVALGALVEAAAPAAVNTAEANGLGKVSTHAEDVTTTTTLQATTFKHNWKLVSGTGDDEDTTAVIMCV